MRLGRACIAGTHRASDRYRVVAEPLRIAHFIELMVGELEHRGDNLGLFGYNVVAVLRQKHEARQESGTFIPVDKAVVLREARRIRGSQVKQIRLAVRKQVVGAGKRRLDCAPVANSRGPSELEETFLMENQNRVQVDPDRRLVQRASSRIAGA